MCYCAVVVETKGNPKPVSEEMTKWWSSFKMEITNQDLSRCGDINCLINDMSEEFAFPNYLKKVIIPWQTDVCVISVKVSHTRDPYLICIPAVVFPKEGIVYTITNSDKNQFGTFMLNRQSKETLRWDYFCNSELKYGC